MTPRAGPLRILVVDDEAGNPFAFACEPGEPGLYRRHAPMRTPLSTWSAGTRPISWSSDLGLPDMDGLDVVSQIRDGGENLPIIILSSRENEKRQGQSVRSWRRRLCHKTFRYDELLARIRTAQRHRLQQRARGLCSMLAISASISCAKNRHRAGKRS